MQSEQPINIQRVLSDIRLEIAAKGLRNTVLPFEEVHASPFEAVTSYDPARFSQLVSDMDRQKQVRAYRKLRSNRIIGPAIIFVKKIIRKMSKFYIEPIVEDQNAFNATVVQGMQSIRALIKNPENEMLMLQAIRDLREENIELRSRIEKLEFQERKPEDA